MRKIFLSAGHGGKDPGASFGSYIERDLAIELRDLIIIQLKEYGVTPLTDDNKNALSETLAWLRGKFLSKDILFDIHWNAAGNPQANGTEVIVPDVSSMFERKLGTAILRMFTDMGFKPRGLKPESQTARKRIGWMRPNAENLLIEVCFITNNYDMKLYQANKVKIASQLAKILYEYSKL